MLEENKNTEQKNQNPSLWKKYFTGWNFVINTLIALIPASLTIGILREMGFGGALILGGVLWGFIYLAGLLREKISKRSQKNVKQVDKAENKKIIKNNKPKNKKPVWIIILVVVIGIVIFFSILSDQQKSSGQNSRTENTENNEQITGNLYRNNQYKFRIKFPDGWEIEDGDGPHIVKKATEEGSTVLIYVKDFFEGEEGQSLLDEIKREYKIETGINISDDQVKQSMAEITADDFLNEEFKEMMNGVSEGILSKYDGVKILDEEIRYLDNKKAFYVKSEVSYKALDLEVQGIMINYITLYNGNIYMVGGASPKDEFSIIEKQIIPSIGSFVFENF